MGDCVTVDHDAALVGDWRKSAGQPRVCEGPTVMKMKLRFVRYCGLALAILANALKGVYWFMKILGEVTNYYAKSLRPSFPIKAGHSRLRSHE